MARPIPYTRPWLYQKQAAFVDDPARITCVESTTKAGKAQPLDATVYTPLGPTKMGILKVGDRVLTPDGVSPIVGIYPQGEQDVYRVNFKDGSSCECTLDHLWEVHRHPVTSPRRGANKNIPGPENRTYRKDHIAWPRVMSLRELLQLSEKSLKRKWVSLCSATKYESQPVDLDPYFVGVLIGDGGLTASIRFTSADEFIVQKMRSLMPEHYDCVNVSNGKHNYDYNLSAGPKMAAILGKSGESLTKRLQNCGLHGKYSHEKFIPDVYKYNSEEVRWSIIRGLMDTDGYVDKHGQPCFDVSSEKLAADFIEVAESLGASCRMNVKENCHYIKDGVRHDCRPSYRVQVKYPDAKMFFSLPRKRDAAKPKKKKCYRSFDSIELVRCAPCQCIKLADPRGLYLTDRHIVTHNTVGLIVWIMERVMAGEEGQHFWWVAPIFPQAYIAFERLRKWLSDSSLPRHIWEANNSKVTINFAGRIIDFKGSDDPDSLYGQDVYACVMDEASRIKQDAFFAVRSVVTATRAPIKIIGNVHGRKNWFYRLARRAQAGDKGLSYHKITCYDAVEAGILAKEEIDSAKRDLPPSVFRELYMAEAADDEGSPFGMDAIRACTMSGLADGPAVVYGVDLAKSQDFTWIIGINALGYVCESERWQSDWQQTMDRLARMIGATPALIDSTGVGDPIVEGLQRVLPNVEGFKFTQQSKQQLMEGLAAAFQMHTIGVPAGELVNELESFEYTYTRTGVRYAACEGMHDDGVCALALGVKKYTNPGMQLPMISDWGEIGLIG